MNFLLVEHIRLNIDQDIISGSLNRARPSQMDAIRSSLDGLMSGPDSDGYFGNSEAFQAVIPQTAAEIVSDESQLDEALTELADLSCLEAGTKLLDQMHALSNYLSSAREAIGTYGYEYRRIDLDHYVNSIIRDYSNPTDETFNDAQSFLDWISWVQDRISDDGIIDPTQFVGESEIVILGDNSKGLIAGWDLVKNDLIGNAPIMPMHIRLEAIKGNPVNIPTLEKMAEEPTIGMMVPWIRNAISGTTQMRQKVVSEVIDLFEQSLQATVDTDDDVAEIDRVCDVILDIDKLIQKDEGLSLELIKRALKFDEVNTGNGSSVIFYNAVANPYTQTQFTAAMKAKEGFRNDALNAPATTPQWLINAISGVFENPDEEFSNEADPIKQLGIAQRTIQLIEAVKHAVEMDEDEARAAALVAAIEDDDFRDNVTHYCLWERRRVDLCTLRLPMYHENYLECEAAAYKKIRDDIINDLRQKFASMVIENGKNSFAFAQSISNMLKNASDDKFSEKLDTLSEEPLFEGNSIGLSLIANGQRSGDCATKFVNDFIQLVEDAKNAIGAVERVSLDLFNQLDEIIVTADKDRLEALDDQIRSIYDFDHMYQWAEGDGFTHLAADVGYIGKFEPLYTEFYKQTDAAFDVIERNRGTITQALDMFEYVGGLSGHLEVVGNPEDEQSASDSRRLQHFDLFAAICRASPQQNTSLTQIFQNIIGDVVQTVLGETKTPIAQLVWDEGDCLAVDNIKEFMHTRSSAAMLKMLACRNYADILLPSADKAYVSGPGFRDAVSFRSIDLMFDALQCTLTYTDFSNQWPLANTREWASAQRKDASEIAKTLAFDFLNAIRDCWGKDSSELGNVASQYKDIRYYSVVTECLSSVIDQPAHILEYMYERIPEFISHTEGLGHEWHVDSKFVDTHLLDFSLHDDLGAPRLSSLVNHEMIFEIINTTNDPISFGAAQTPPDPDIDPNTKAGAMDCHFILRFKLGALVDGLNNIGLEGPSEGWEIVGRMQRPIHMPLYDEIYIRAPENAPAIEPGHSRHLILTQMRGADSGTRTTRVLMMHQGLVQNDEAALPGHREKRLKIANELPDSTTQSYKLPLHVGLVGPGTIINDGTANNRLNIALTSTVLTTHNRQVTFGKLGSALQGTTRTRQKRTKIIVSIDTNDRGFAEQKDWAFCNRQEAGGIVASLGREGLAPGLVSSGDSFYWASSFTSQGTRAEWVFTVPNNVDSANAFLTLPRHSSLILQLDGIASTLPSGPCNIYIHCENFPGFPDRKFVVQANKTGVGEVDRRDLYERSDTDQKPDELHIASKYLGNLERLGIAEKEVNVKALFEKVKEALCPAGTIVSFASGQKKPPAGWLFCDGIAIPKGNQYDKLRDMFENGCTPNLAYRMIIGAGDSTIGDYHAPDGLSGSLNDGKNMPLHHVDGNWEHILDLSEIPDHKHHDYFSGTKDGKPRADGKGGLYWYDDGVNRLTDVSMSPIGAQTQASSAHPNMPPYYALNYIIKY